MTASLSKALNWNKHVCGNALETGIPALFALLCSTSWRREHFGATVTTTCTTMYVLDRTTPPLKPKRLTSHQ